MSRFQSLFGIKPVIGMIHLSGGESTRIERALEELTIYEEQGINGAIIENYHGSDQDVATVLDIVSKRRTRLILGVNILPNEFDLAFTLAKRYGAGFIQIDYVAGRYSGGEEIDVADYQEKRRSFQDILVLGGVWPKYYAPIEGSNLEDDVREGIQRADALVVTGEGTGKETPLEKIKSFRRVAGDQFPLIVGAGATPTNIVDALQIADGVIVGSYLKRDEITRYPVDRQRVQEFMIAVARARP